MLAWSDDDPSAGFLTLSSADVWADVRAGTIITIAEDYSILDEDASPVVAGSDLSTNYIQNGGDWWMHFTTRDSEGNPDTTYLSTDNDGTFAVNNDDWQMDIRDAASSLVFGPIGEGVADWGGGGLGKKEVGKLEANPSLSTTASSIPPKSAKSSPTKS